MSIVLPLSLDTRLTWRLQTPPRYSYLIQAEEEDWQVKADHTNKFVFNTEAHPLRIAAGSERTFFLLKEFWRVTASTTRVWFGALGVRRIGPLGFARYEGL